MFSGRKVQVGVGIETTRGTAVAPSFWIRKIEATVDEKRAYVEDDASVGVLADGVGSEVGKSWAEGEIRGYVLDLSFGVFLYGAFGSVASVETADTGVYDHTFSMSTSNTKPSLTIDVKSDVEQNKHTLGTIGSMKISGEAGKMVDFVVGMRAKAGVASTNTPSYEIAETHFVAKHVNLYVASDLAGLSGATAGKVRNFEISIAGNLEDHDVIGDDEPVDFASKFVSVEGNLEAMFESASEYKALFKAGTKKALRIKAVNSDVTIGASSHPQLTIDLPLVAFEDWSRKSGNNEIVSQTIKFKGYYSLEEALLIEAVLRNEQVSYV